MNIGVVGAGDIAQIMHLPYLVEIPDVDLHAITDPGTNAVETLGERYNIPHRYDNVGVMINELAGDLDGIVVATPMHTHADVAITALEEDLHTFVEKPIAVTPSDAEEVVQAADRSDGKCMVGYMKRYDTGFQQFEEEVADANTIDLITSVVIPPNVGTVIDETYDLVRADLDEEFLSESNRERIEQLEQAIGTDDETLTRAYAHHLESICHDINALRALFGSVEQIDYVDVFNDWKYTTAQLRYEGGRRCILQSGATNRKWYNERIRVDTPESALSVEFGNAFIRNTPTDVQTKQGADKIEEVGYEPSYEEAFKRELKHFIECVVGDTTVQTPTGKTRESVEDSPTIRTPPEEAKKDVELIANLFKTFNKRD